MFRAVCRSIILINDRLGLCQTGDGQENAALVIILFSLSYLSMHSPHLWGLHKRLMCYGGQEELRQQRIPVQLIFNLAIKLKLSKTADTPSDLLLTAWTSKLGSAGAQSRRSKAGQCSSASACWIERLYCCDLCNLHRQVKEILKHATVPTFTGYTIHWENKCRLSIWNLLWICIEVFCFLYYNDSYPHLTPEYGKFGISNSVNAPNEALNKAD